MFKKILGTAGAKLLIALTSFLVLIIKTNHLGKEGVATAGIILLGITIVLLINEFIGGHVLIYLVPRRSVFELMVPSYVWAFFVSAAGTIVLAVLNLIPREYAHHVFALSLIQCCAMVNMNVLLGKENIRMYNIISIAQTVSLFLAFAFFIYVLKRAEVMTYVYAIYFDYAVVFILSSVFVRKYIRFRRPGGMGKVVKEILKYGSFIQLAHIIQLINVRLSFYIIESILGMATLGVYYVAIKISEGVLLVGKSVAIVQYARISNADNFKYSTKLTLNLMVFTSIITTFFVGFILICPDVLFQWVFGRGFGDLRFIMLTLSVGVLSIPFSMMFTHFFSGIGKPHYNVIAALIEGVLIVIFGYTCIPKYGLLGAGITGSIAYFGHALFLSIVFVKITRTGISDVVDSIRNIIPFVKEMKKYLS